MTAIILRRRKLGRTSAAKIAELSKNDICVVRNDQPFPANITLAFRWGCTSNVPTKNVVNTAEAIHLSSDKAGFRKILNEHQLCPPTFYSPEEVGEYDGDLAGGVVVRPKVHAQGRHVYLCKTPAELNEAIVKCGDGYYISKFIDKTHEYRVFVVSGRVVCVAKKTPADPKAIAWNVARGGRFDNVRWDDWPLKACKLAIAAWELSGLDFGGVDVMVDKDGNCTVLEINSAPSLTSPYRQECFAKAFDYIVEHGKAKIPLVEAKGGYLKFIHPAITANAKV